MSLTPDQRAATRAEFAANLRLSGQTPRRVAVGLHISEAKLQRVMTLTQQSLNDPWILRNYLLAAVAATGQTPVPFTALAGDWHRYWFLDADAIDQQAMSPGDQ
ncbi:DUF2316 family protein [Lacticaseibacillus absianus]|uniref:DUF2316 family protein n=1 Tax=Lacticaseibacillus absianus TaxID=2729623 RepID=UPI0015C8685F|nr:DUF2316 family protein [Lacticaseibacillus absianus]